MLARYFQSAGDQTLLGHVFRWLLRRPQFNNQIRLVYCGVFCGLFCCYSFDVFSACVNNTCCRQHIQCRHSVCDWDMITSAGTLIPLSAKPLASGAWKHWSRFAEWQGPQRIKTVPDSCIHFKVQLCYFKKKPLNFCYKWVGSLQKLFAIQYNFTFMYM